MRLLPLFAFVPMFACSGFAIAQMQSLGPRDALAAAKLPQREVREVIQAVEQAAYDTPDSWERELRVRKVDLGAAPGLLVQGTKLLCGGTGNCQTWVLRRSAGKWTSMFAGDEAPLAESFQLGPSLTAGIKDLTIVTNSSAEAGQRVTYKFDGGFYRAKR